MAEILLREQARNDLYAIIEYMAGQNPDLPQRFIDELQRVYDVLHDHPELGRETWFITKRNYLMYPMVKYSYALFYLIENGQPVITRVLHGKRDLEALFGEQD